MRALALGALAALACAALACGAPALAVDRSVGAAVPKPAVTGTPWTEAEIAALDANVDVAIAGASVLRGAHAGLYAIDARDGRVLYERNQDDLFQPASTFKLLVGSAALERLGRDARFHTEVIANGVPAGGVLDGQLILRGGGDPFLNAADLDAAAAAVVRAGIRRVTSGIAIDDSHFETPGYLPGWNWDDFPFYYAPVVGALVLEENVVHLTVTPGASAGAPATVTAAPIGTVTSRENCAPTAGVLIAPAGLITGAAGAADTVDVARDPWGCILVTGTIPLDAKPDVVEAAVPSPSGYANDAFAAALARHGVAVFQAGHPAGPESFRPDDHRAVPAAVPGAAVVWAHDSEPLADALADMWLPSDNLVAEVLLRQIGFAQAGAPGTTAAGAQWETGWLKSLGVDVDRLAIVDGSGLSTYDRITPRGLVTVLKHDWDGPNRDLVLDALPIAGVRGTLRNAFKGTPADGAVFAKTGTISHVSTLAGYAANAKHGAVIFAFQVDDWVGASADLRELRARVLAQFVAS